MVMTFGSAGAAQALWLNNLVPWVVVLVAGWLG